MTFPLAECRNVFCMQEWFCILVKRCMCILVWHQSICS